MFTDEIIGDKYCGCGKLQLKGSLGSLPKTCPFLAAFIAGAQSPIVTPLLQTVLQREQEKTSS